ncbi:hypothetical protein FQA39_LY13505 [Lamprigera yunnana]|nr:hypothetical protein FQA39_LY13505 [Lamprigera yunnana]
MLCVNTKESDVKEPKSEENVKVEVQFEEDDAIGDKENYNSLPKCESVICNEGGLREDTKKRHKLTPVPVHIDKKYNIQNSESKQVNRSPVKSHKFKKTSPITYTATYRVAPGESGGIASKVAALFQNKATINRQQIQNNIKQQTQKEMDVLLHRFQKNKNITIPNEVSDSESENGFDATETTAMIDTKHAEILKDYKE